MEALCSLLCEDKQVAVRPEGIPIIIKEVGMACELRVESGTSSPVGQGGGKFFLLWVWSLGNGCNKPVVQNVDHESERLLQLDVCSLCFCCKQEGSFSFGIGNLTIKRMRGSKTDWNFRGWCQLLGKFSFSLISAYSLEVVVSLFVVR